MESLSLYDIFSNIPNDVVDIIAIKKQQLLKSDLAIQIANVHYNKFYKAIEIIEYYCRNPPPHKMDFDRRIPVFIALYNEGYFDSFTQLFLFLSKYINFVENQHDILYFLRDYRISLNSVLKSYYDDINTNTNININ